MKDYNEGKFQGQINTFSPITNDTELIDLTKRYWVLAWTAYYPEGGFNDVKFSSDDMEDAEKQLDKMLERYKDEEGQCELWDMQERKMLKGFEFCYSYNEPVEIKEDGE